MNKLKYLVFLLSLITSLVSFQYNAVAADDNDNDSYYEESDSEDYDDEAPPRDSQDEEIGE